MIQLDDEANIYIKNGCFTKESFKNGCLLGCLAGTDRNDP